MNTSFLQKLYTLTRFLVPQNRRQGLAEASQASSPRKPETLAAYEAFKQENTPEERALFDFADETVVREYGHWVIIHSRFPYDTMARVNDLLILKRPVSRHADMTKAERDEYESILSEISASGTYDAIIENFTHTKSVPKQLHMHLICWHLSE